MPSPRPTFRPPVLLIDSHSLAAAEMISAVIDHVDPQLVRAGWLIHHLIEVWMVSSSHLRAVNKGLHLHNAPGRCGRDLDVDDSTQSVSAKINVGQSSGRCTSDLDLIHVHV